jgi:DNA-binding transcriptional LysR family regulator
MRVSPEVPPIVRQRRARPGGFTRAVARQHVAQPALSQQIRRLEAAVAPGR